MRDTDVRYWCEMAEAIAWRDIYEAVQEQGDTALGPAWAEVGGAVAFALRGLDDAYFNRVVGLGIPRPATLQDVADADEFFHALGRERSTLQIVEPATPAALTEWIEAAGWVRSRQWPKLWRSLDGELPLSRTDLRIEQVGPDWAEDFARIVTTTYEFDAALAPVASAPMGRPGWSHYLGFDGEDAVAAGASFVTADVVWLGYGATLESHRGRGGQSAIFASRLADARAAGCRLAITETGEDTPEEPNPSYRNMLRAGFEVAYLRPNFVRRPAET
jgi:GNAT superfamily N-acetyltransferase